MTPKLIALDLDETTLNRDSRLSAENRCALESAIAQHIEIVVATGRSYDTIPEEIRRFPGIRYAITGNGAAIYDLTEQQAILRHTLSPASVEQIMRRSSGENLAYETFVDGRAYAQADYIQHPEQYMADEQTKTYVQATRRPVDDIRSFIWEHRAELDSLDLVAADLETKHRMMTRMRQVDDIYITTSVPRLVELSHRDCGKHQGLQFVASRLGIPQAETAAFGNADNDAEMLAWAGIGVAVANASEACKAAADQLTGAYWENGVANAFRALFSLEWPDAHE